jgi:hypothetical protein
MGVHQHMVDILHLHFLQTSVKRKIQITKQKNRGRITLDFLPILASIVTEKDMFIQQQFIYCFTNCAGISVCLTVHILFVGLAYPGNDIVFRFIIEYSSLRDFGLY